MSQFDSTAGCAPQLVVEGTDVGTQRFFVPGAVAVGVGFDVGVLL